MLKTAKVVTNVGQLTYVHFTQMDARNLAIMFGPSLVRPNDESMVAMVRDMSDQCRIVESIILHVCNSALLALIDHVVLSSFLHC